MSYASKDELFSCADVLTIHLVLGERTRGLVGIARWLGQVSDRQPRRTPARPGRFKTTHH